MDTPPLDLTSAAIRDRAIADAREAERHMAELREALRVLVDLCEQQDSDEGVDADAFDAAMEVARALLAKAKP